MYYTYMIRCEDNSIYTGITNNVEKRFNNHINGKGAKYTKSHKPKAIVYVDILENKSLALKEEYRIKKTLNRSKKLELIEANKNKTKDILDSVLN